MALKSFILWWWLLALASPLVTVSTAQAQREHGYVNVELSSHELHQLQREAMDATLKIKSTSTSSSSPDDDAIDNDGNDFFSSASVQEQRAYYYFHAGIEMAAINTMTMARGSDYADELAEDQDDMLDYLEKRLEHELERVKRELGEIDIDRGRGHGEDVEDMAEEEAAESESGSESEATPKERLLEQFTREYAHFQCNKYTEEGISLEEAKGKWKEFRHQFWKFARLENDNENKRSAQTSEEEEDDDDDNNHGYIQSPDLYVDFVTTDTDDHEENNDSNNSSSSSNDKPTTRRRGLFAARDFRIGQVVYSQDASNRIYFQEESVLVNFLHFLPNPRDACLVLEWSFMKQISRPGRWLLGLVLDEGVFMRQLLDNDKAKSEEEESEEEEEEEEGEGNVDLKDERSFDYLALRYIYEGEEIIDRALGRSDL